MEFTNPSSVIVLEKGSTLKGFGKRRVNLRALVMALAMVTATLTGMITTTAPAAAATGNIQPPFTIGEQWWVCQGYNSSFSHNGTSAYGIDLVGGPSCDNSASGRAVKAPASGTVAYYEAEFGNLCINKTGGGSYTLTHISPSVTSGTVTAGQAVGVVAAAQPNPLVPPRNNNVAHIHFQMWATANCYSSSGVPFDSAHGARICGAPDLTATGGTSTGNGMWSGTSFVGASCGGGATPWQWHLSNSLTDGPAFTAFSYGSHSSDHPITGDWDGNGAVTAGITRAG